MSNLNIKVSGMYEDWCEIEFDGRIIYNGSTFSLFKEYDNKLLICLNYGSDELYNYTICKNNELYLGIPYFASDRDFVKYFPTFIVSQNELNRIIEKIYTDKVVLDLISPSTQDDLITIWINTLKAYNMGITNEYITVKGLVHNIVYVSDDVLSLEKLQDSLNKEFKLLPINKKGSEEIILYLEISDTTVEWKSMFKKGEKYYLDLNTDYALQIML